MHQEVCVTTLDWSTGLFPNSHLISTPVRQSPRPMSCSSRTGCGDLISAWVSLSARMKNSVTIVARKGANMLRLLHPHHCHWGSLSIASKLTCCCILMYLGHHSKVYTRSRVPRNYRKGLAFDVRGAGLNTSTATLKASRV